MATTSVGLKNKRLNERDRDALMAFATKQIIATEDSAEVDAAYEIAANAVHAAVIAKFPQKDMTVLARYGAASPDRCVYVSTGGSNYDRFEFREGDKRIPVRPDLRGCNRQALLLTGDDEAAYDDYKAKLGKLEATRKARRRDFSALVSGTPSFNALVEVWPAADVMREQIVGSATALAVLSSEVIDRLNADPALQMAEAA